MLNISSASNYNDTIDEESMSDVLFTLSIIDCIIVGVYLIASVSLGLYIGRKHKTSEDYFLAGRSMKWPFVGLSLFATNVSSSSLVGLTGSAFKNGIGVYNYIWSSAVILVIFATFFLPSILKSGIHTLPEMLEVRYNSVIRYYFSILTIVLIIAGSSGGALYGGALVVRMVFPQLEIWHAVVILAVLAGVYTISGGLIAVIYTDSLQAVTLVLGSIIIAVFAYVESGGWSAVRNEVQPEHLSLIKSVNDPNMPWTGVVFGIPILGFYYWCTNQSIVQRMLSSKDSNHGRWGCMLSGFCNLSILFIIILPGTMARLIFPNLPKADLIFPKLMFTLLPVGVLGIVLSGFVAALLSDIDSDLNSASTLITMDFAKKLKPDLTERQLMIIGRVVTFFVTVAAASWAPFIGNFGSLYQYLQTLLSYLTPPVVTLHLVGFFWKGATGRGAIVTLIVGNIACILFFVFNEIFEYMGLHFLHVAPILCVINALILIVASLVGGGESSKEQLNITWSFTDFKEEIFSMKDQPFWKNYHLHSFLLLITTGIIVGFFW